MDFIKRRLSISSDPDRDKEDKAKSPSDSTNILDSISSKRSAIWNDLTLKMKSDKTSPNGTDPPATADSKQPRSNGFGFMETVKQKLTQVRQHYNSNGSNTDKEDVKSDVECAPLIETAGASDDGCDVNGSMEDGDDAISDKATVGESEVGENPDDGNTKILHKRRLTKRQDSFTAEEVYLGTVAAQVNAGLLPPDNRAVVVSPSVAVKEFSFNEKSGKKTSHKQKVGKPANGGGGLAPPCNLINFDSMQNLSNAAAASAEVVVHHEDDGVFDYESSGDESSEPQYTEELASKRSDSLESLKSVESNFDDEESKEYKEFAFMFIDNVFSDTANTNDDKAKFGRYVQDGDFRVHFAKAVSEKRVTTKAVTEHTFYQLVQYFAVVLFECEEADDFTPAMILMNMCFTFYYEGSRGGVIEKNYLFTYLKSQPIWQSMRYWNAAFYEAVQKERTRKPLTTNNKEDENSVTTAAPINELSASPVDSDQTCKDTADDMTFDRTFQENIIFGQLGTFLYNMRAFGLDLEWCLEFLRKQAIIGNLNQEQIQMLRECVEADQFGHCNGS